MGVRSGVAQCIWLAIVALQFGACGSERQSGGPVSPSDNPGASNRATIDPDTCPALEDNPAGKISHEDFLRRRAGKGERVSIWMRPGAYPDLPDCEACDARDAALKVRAALNAQQLACIVADGFRAEARGIDARAVYWEQPLRLASGRPVPTLLAFETSVTWELAQRLATHPYIERIEPAPGDVPFLGVAAPPAPQDCPKERQRAAAKLEDAAALRGMGRQGVVISLVQKGYLPEPAQCPAAQPQCDAWTNAEWERYLLNQRSVTCVLRELDGIVGNGEWVVQASGISGSPMTAPVPPLGALPSVLFEFGRALTWEEAGKLAAHPYVASIRFQPRDAIKPTAGCPLDTTRAVPKPSCGVTRESATNKWSQADEMRWKARPGENGVMLMIEGGGEVCDMTSCPPPPNACPEQGAMQSYLEEWNWQSQKCVRAEIERLGGFATDERFWLVNAIVARMTWEQIQEMATHPHVASIQSSDDGAPPPG